MKRGIVFLILAVLALSIILTGCKEQSGQALRTVTLQRPVVSPSVSVDTCKDKVYCRDTNTLLREDYNYENGRCVFKGKFPTQCEFGCDSLRKACNACATETWRECNELTVIEVTKSQATGCRERRNAVAQCGPADTCVDGNCIHAPEPEVEVCEPYYNITCHNTTNMVNATMNATCDYKVYNYPLCPDGCNFDSGWCN